MFANSFEKVEVLKTLSLFPPDEFHPVKFFRKITPWWIPPGEIPSDAFFKYLIDWSPVL